MTTRTPGRGDDGSARAALLRSIFSLGVLALPFGCESTGRTGEVEDSGPEIPAVHLPDGNQAGDYGVSWVARVSGGESSINWGNGAAVDDWGCTYFSGNYMGTASFHDASGQIAAQLEPAGFESGFLARFSPSGSLLWTTPLGGTGDDKALDVASVEGGVVVSGWFENAMRLGSPPKQAVLESEGMRDGYIARFTSEGKLLWARSFGGPGDLDAFFDLKTTADGRIAAVGVFRECAVVGRGEQNETHLETGGTQEGAVLAVYAADGTLDWARAVTRSAFEVSARGIAALPDGSLIVGGIFEGSAVVGFGEENETALQADGERDFFLARYSADGALDWAVGLGIVGRAYHPRSSATVALAPNGDIVVAAGFCGGAPIGKAGDPAVMHWTQEGACTPYVARFTADGIRVWSIAPGGGGALSHALGVSVLPSGMIAVGGRCSGNASFGSGEVHETLLEPSNTKWFLALFDPSGSLQWAISDPGQNGRNWITDVDSADGTIVASGGFELFATFGTGMFDSVAFESGGEADAFLIRMDEAGLAPD